MASSTCKRGRTVQFHSEIGSFADEVMERRCVNDRSALSCDATAANIPKVNLMGDLTFRTLRGANTARQPEQAGKAKADVPFRTVEFAAASGQLAEVIRQLLRVDRSNKGGSAILADVASRMG